MRLPLTLAVIDGLVVKVGAERYIIPMLSIVTLLRAEEGAISTALQRGEMFKLQDKFVSLFRLNRLFQLDGAEKDTTKALIVVVEEGGQQAGILVDKLEGQQQVVIKSLGDTMRGILGISSGAIMPDGKVGLILDVGGLVKLAHTKTTLSEKTKIKQENL